MSLSSTMVSNNWNKKKVILVIWELNETSVMKQIQAKLRLEQEYLIT